MVKRLDYHDEDRFAFGVPMPQYRKTASWSLGNQAAFGAGLASTAGALAYNAIPTKAKMARVLADAYIAYKGEDNLARDFDLKHSKFLMDGRNQRFDSGVVPYGKARQNPTRPRSLVRFTEHRFDRLSDIPRKHANRHVGLRVSPKHEDILVEDENGINVDLPTYSSAKDDVPIGYQATSNVVVNDAKVMQTSKQDLTYIAGTNITNDDGDGAVLVKLKSGKVMWQVGNLRFPVQYMGDRPVPFSYSSGRYAHIIPQVNVVW
jgi:hypothetical protein